MCGILGVFGKTPMVDDSRFTVMRDSLVHRGPDDQGTWRSPDGLVTLGSRRLAILDLSEMGHMPMVSRTGNAVIVLNGEIYNYVELREQLSQKGHRFFSSGDTEVLLAAYEEWGTDCLSRLNGMFAFALWDEKQKGLFAARDRFGEKPFYYFYDRSRDLFLFASEMKAIFASGLVDPVADLSAVRSFMTAYRIDHEESTMFRGVKSLLGSHALLLSSSGFELKTWRYWDLNPESETHFATNEAYAETFRELLSDSVRLRLRSDVPVGSSLSGGLDSSAIVGLIAEQYQGQRQETFSARFGDGRLDEGRHIDEVCAFLNVENHPIYPDATRFHLEAERLTWHQEEPTYSTGIFASWDVYRLAREHDVTVLLDGQGADEMLAGYPTYLGACVQGLCAQGRFGEAWSAIRAQTKSHSMTSLPVAMATLVPSGARSAARGVFRPRELSREFERAVPRTHSNGKNQFADPLKKEMYTTLMCSVLPCLLRYVDRNSMAFSREVRLPFLDHRLAEFLFSIPADQIVRHGVSKAILRDAVRGLIPETIRLRRDKIGYATPLETWMSGPMRNWVRELLFSRESLTRPWIDAEILGKTWKRFEAGDALAIRTTWKWLSLETWALIYLDGRWRGLLPNEHSTGNKVPRREHGDTRARTVVST